MSARETALAELVLGALHQWSEAIADDDYPCNGGDMVEWFLGEFVPDAKEALATAQQMPNAIDAAIVNLRSARDALARAGAPRTLAKVRSALKSADGARRHALRMDVRDDVLNQQRVDEELEQPDRIVIAR